MDVDGMVHAYSWNVFLFFTRIHRGGCSTHCERVGRAVNAVKLCMRVASGLVPRD